MDKYILLFGAYVFFGVCVCVLPSSLFSSQQLLKEVFIKYLARIAYFCQCFLDFYFPVEIQSHLVTKTKMSKIKNMTARITTKNPSSKRENQSFDPGFQCLRIKLHPAQVYKMRVPINSVD